MTQQLPPSLAEETLKNAQMANRFAPGSPTKPSKFTDLQLEESAKIETLTAELEGFESQIPSATEDLIGTVNEKYGPTRQGFLAGSVSDPIRSTGNLFSVQGQLDNIKRMFNVNAGFTASRRDLDFAAIQQIEKAKSEQEIKDYQNLFATIIPLREELFWRIYRTNMLEAIPYFLATNPQISLEEIISLSRSGDDTTIPNDTRAFLENAMVVATDQRRIDREFGDNFLEDIKTGGGSLEKLMSIDPDILTGEELVMSLVEAAQYDLPEGMTADQAREVFILLGYSPEEADGQIFNAQAEALRISNELRAWDAQHQILLDEGQRLQSREIVSRVKKALWLKAVTQPAIMVMRPLEFWLEQLVRPLAASTIRNMGIVQDVVFSQSTQQGFGFAVAQIFDPLGRRFDEEDRGFSSAEELEVLYQRARHDGESYWEANRIAFEEWDTNAYHKFALEVIFDPLTYVGMGVYWRGANAIHPVLGGAVKTFEKGFTKMAEYPFNMLAKGIKGITPRTLIQRGTTHGQRTIDLGRQAYASAESGANIYMADPIDLQAFATRAVEEAIENPGGPDLITKFGKGLLGYRTIGIDDVKSLTDELAEFTTRWNPTDLNTHKLNNLNYVYDLTKGGGISKFLHPNETASWLLKELDIVGDPKAFKVTVNWIKAQQAALKRAALEPFDIDDVKDQLVGTVNRLAEDFKAAQVSQIANHRYQSGIIGASLQGMDTVSRRLFIEGLDKFVTQRFARAYLVFAAYGVMNIAESAMKTALAGVNPFYRGDPYAKNRFLFHAIEGDVSIGLVLPQRFNLGLGMPVDDIKKISQLPADHVEARQALSRFEKYVADFNAGNTLKSLGESLKTITGTNFGNRVTGAIYANYSGKMYLKMLTERVPEVVEAVGKTVVKDTVGLEAFMSKMAADGYRDAISMAILTGDGDFLLAVPRNFTPGKVLRAHSEKILDRYTELPRDLTSWVNNQVESGRLWTTEGFNEAHEVAMGRIREHYYSMPGVFDDNFKDIVEAIIEHPVETAVDLNEKLNLIHHTIEIFHDTTSTVLNAAVHHAHTLRNSEAASAHFNNIWATRVTPRVNSVTFGVEDVVSEMRKHLDDAAFVATLKPGNKEKYNVLMNRLLTRSELFRKARSEYDAVRRSYTTPGGANYKPGKQRNDAWWQKFLASTRQPWDDAFAEINNTGADIIRLQAQLNDEIIPRLPDLSRSEMTRLDIARLYGVHGMDIERAMYMTEITAIKPKATFIADTMNRAQISAESFGKSAAEMGWTKEEVGRIYNDIVEKMVANPDIQSGMEPMTIQFESAMKELTALGLQKNAIMGPEAEHQLNLTVANLHRKIFGPSIRRGPDEIVPQFDAGLLALPSGDDVIARQAKLVTDVRNQALAASREFAELKADSVTLLKTKRNLRQARSRLNQMQDRADNLDEAADFYRTFGTASDSLDIYEGHIHTGNSRLARSQRQEAWNTFVLDFEKIQLEEPHKIAAYQARQIKRGFAPGSPGSDLGSSRLSLDGKEISVGDRGLKVSVLTSGLAPGGEAQSITLRVTSPEHGELMVQAIELTPRNAALSEYDLRVDVARVSDAQGADVGALEALPKGAINSRESREISRLLSGMFPEAEKIGGKRVTGAKVSFKPATNEEALAAAGGFVKPERASRLEATAFQESEYSKDIMRVRNQIDQFTETEWPPNADDLSDWLEALNIDIDISSKTAASRQLTLESENAAQRAQKFANEAEDIVLDAEIVTVQRGLEIISERRRKISSTPQVIKASRLGNLKEETLRQISIVDEGLPVGPEVKWNRVATRENFTPTTSRTSSLDIERARYVGHPDYQKIRTDALQETNLRRSLDFPDYDNQTAVSAFMKQIFPFWGYESHRFAWWLPREALRHPGIWSAWGKYENNTDLGYNHIPGTSLDINPIRGTIFMGGFRRLAMRDFPEFYDNFEGFAEITDHASRFGFYPGVPVGAALAIYGPKSQKSQFGELLPPTARTVLAGITAIAPQTGPVLNDVIFPDRFRDYLIALEVTRLDFNTPEGISGTTILKKRLLGEELTLQEDAIWKRATRGIGAWQILFEQTGMFRFNPQEKILVWKLANEALSEATGIPVDDLEDLRRHGIRIEEVVGALSPATKEALNQLEQWVRFTGASVALLPSAEGNARALVAEFWDTFSVRMDEERELLVQMENQHRNNPNKATYEAWERQLALKGRASAQILADLKALPRYSTIPTTIIERKEFAEKTGIQIFFHPLEELRELFFSQGLDDVWSEELQRMVPDFESMFLHRDVIENSLSGDQGERLQQLNSLKASPLENLRHEITRDYLRPYRLIFEAVLKTYSDEDQILIAKARSATGDARKEFREMEDADGNKIIAKFEGEVRTVRSNMRANDPVLDAWLLFFRIVDSAATEEANEMFNQMEARFKLQGVAGIAP